MRALFMKIPSRCAFSMSVWQVDTANVHTSADTKVRPYMVKTVSLAR